VDNRQAGLHNNIEADLLRRVSSGAPAQPEAYQLDKRWVIAFAQAVVAPGARYAAGAILLTVPAQTLEQSLTAQLAARGEAQLQQLAGTQGIRFAAAGSGDEPAHAVATRIKNANWQLQLTPAAKWLDHSRESPLILLLMLALSAAAILAGMLISARDFRNALERSLHALLGKHAPELPGFAEVREQLQRRALSSAPKEAAVDTRSAEKVEPAAPLVEELESLPVQMPDSIFRAYDIR